MHSNYDTHHENFDFHIEQLGEFDRPFAALLDDLADRGMLESTLVVVMSEFGRTPRINDRYGRDHWGKAWSVALGGCGIKAGAVVGKTNANGTAVTDREVNGGHLFHTYLQAVGIDSLEAHHGWVRAVAVSPDGQLVASCGNDLLVKLWRASDGSTVRTLAGHASHVYNLAFHPASGRLVSCDLKGELIDWEVETGKEVRRLHAAALHKYDTTFKADIGGARGLAFSRDGRLLAAAGITNVSNAFAGVGDPVVLVWDWDSGAEPKAHKSKADLRGAAWNVAIHPEGFLIALSGGGGGGHLLFWKPEEEQAYHSFKLPNTARDMDLHPDALRVASAHADGHLRIVKLADKG
jgi:WD40 repeat protein